MSQYLEKVASPIVLNDAWHTLRDHHRRSTCSWYGDLSLKDMQPNLIRHVGELSELLLTGRYCPEPMCCQKINKGQRYLCESAARDQMVQTAILKVLKSLDGTADIFEKHLPKIHLGKIRQLVKAGYIWLGLAKIKDSLDHLPYEGVLKSLYKLCDDKALVSVVRLILESQPDEFRPVGSGRGLPQDMILTPFLHELYLHNWDECFRNKQIPLIRVGDDFIVLAQTQVNANKALARAEKQLEKWSLTLDSDTKQVVQSSFKYTFLGKRLPNGRPLLPFKQLDGPLLKRNRLAVLNFWQTKPATPPTLWERVLDWKKG